MSDAGGQPRILVVDDDEHITELLAMGLGYNGFDVERVASGRPALDAVDRRKPDQDPGAPTRQRRLRHEAVQHRRADRAGQGGCCAGPAT